MQSSDKTGRSTSCTRCRSNIITKSLCKNSAKSPLATHSRATVGRSSWLPIAAATMAMITVTISHLYVLEINICVGKWQPSQSTSCQREWQYFRGDCSVAKQAFISATCVWTTTSLDIIDKATPSQSKQFHTVIPYEEQPGAAIVGRDGRSLVCTALLV